MLSLWEVLKASKGLPAPDGFTALFAEKITGIVSEISGIPPLNLGKAKDVVDYTLYGNTVQNGTPTPDNPVEVQAVGDRTGNLIKKEIVTPGYYFDSSGILNTASHAHLKYLRPVEVKPNTTYTLSTNTTIYTCWTADVLDITREGIKCVAINNSKVTITTGENECYLRISLDTQNSDFEWFMLNEGTEPLPYEPYGYKIPFTTAAEDGTESITTTAYLDKPLYKIGDYADSINYAEQKAERVIKEFVLTGEERWFYSSAYDVENTVRFHSESLLRYRLETKSDLCSHFERMVYNSLNIANKPAFSVANKTQLVFRVSKTDCLTVDDFKSYLAAQYANGTPVKIYYVLEKPETESVTLPKIPTLDGTTVIDVETEIKPSNMNVKYKSRR